MKGTAYLIQATLIALWWIGMMSFPSFFDAFQYPNIHKPAFVALMLPDIVVIALLSVFRAYRESEKLSYIILGGFAFATLYSVNATIITGGGYLGTIVMTLGLCYNLFLVFDNKLFRESTSKSSLVNGVKTLLQIICVWIITLIVFPVLIIHYFQGAIQISNWAIVGICLFITCSLLGLYSSYVMVLKGEGTPLPVDQTNKLVVDGPYKYVRNPMAIAGLGQGIAVSIFFGSVSVLVYTLLGGVLWNYVVRPVEEKNMKERFGEDYQQYVENVKCWMPRFYK